MRTRQLALASLACVLWACQGRTATRVDEPVEEVVPPEPEPTLQTESDKLDVLFVVDNTNTAQFAHLSLAQTIPYFLDRLTSPRCVNGLGQIVDDAPPGEECAVGVRDFAEVRDIHIGVISTSLGGHGADSCSPESFNYDEEQNDRAQLLSRTSSGGQVPTYQGLGFLVWDPDQDDQPPGDSDRDGLNAKIATILDGVGSNGCGFEAPLEAFYRFLIDPSPYASIENDGAVARLVGVDETILEQRAAFLRPDSAVLIVIVSDEDDCSIRDGGQTFFVARNSDGTYRMPRPRAECAVDTDDPCCTSCGSPTPSGCPEDPTCATPLSTDEDPINLRCFDQKRRFGLDFLYPIDRYIDGLTDSQVTTADGQVRPNPLYAGNRSPDMITVAAITGVPWQDIAVSSQSPGGGLVQTAELDWSRLLADGDTPPTDPLMIPSRSPRMGTHPVTEEPVAPPESPVDANSINGHEHLKANDLQYACIYPLPAPFTCDSLECECEDAEADANAVCQDGDTYGAEQLFGRATPATRPLLLLRELPRRSALGSICTTGDPVPSSTSFAFRPTFDSILRMLRRSLLKPE